MTANHNTNPGGAAMDAATIDKVFDGRKKAALAVADLDDRWFLRNALILATRTTSTRADDLVIETIARVADVLGPNRDKIEAAFDWLRDAAKGVFAASQGGVADEDLNVLAGVCAANYAEAA